MFGLICEMQKNFLWKMGLYGEFDLAVFGM